MSEKKMVTEVMLRKVEAGNLRGSGYFVIGGKVKINCTVVEGAEGLFMSLPRYKGSDGKYYSSVFISDEDLYKEINNAVLTKYQELISEGDEEKKTSSKRAAKEDDAVDDGCPF